MIPPTVILVVKAAGKTVQSYQSFRRSVDEGSRQAVQDKYRDELFTALDELSTAVSNQVQVASTKASQRAAKPPVDWNELLGFGKKVIEVGLSVHARRNQKTTPNVSVVDAEIVEDIRK